MSKLLAIVLILAGSAGLGAQAVTGTISGTIVDQQS